MSNKARDIFEDRKADWHRCSDSSVKTLKKTVTKVTENSNRKAVKRSLWQQKKLPAALKPYQKSRPAERLRSERTK